MSVTLEAVIERGTLKLAGPINLPEGTQVRVTITEVAEDVEHRDPLKDVIGICDEGPDISLADRHDELLYALGRKVQP